MILRTCLTAVCFVVLAGMVQAHPPDSLTINVDSTGTTVMATVFHGSKNPTKHSIAKVTVKLNNELIVQQTFKRQTDNTRQEVVYRVIDLNDGDRIEVTGVCSIAGKKSQSLAYKSR